MDYLSDLIIRHQLDFKGSLINMIKEKTVIGNVGISFGTWQEEDRKEHKKLPPISLSTESREKAISWIAGEGTGVSSKTIWSMMMSGEPCKYNDTPHDTSDFGRCYRLLKLIPEFEENLERMKGIKNETRINGYPERGWLEKNTWEVLVDNYKKLCELYELAVKTDDGKEFYDFWRSIRVTDKIS